MVEDNVTAQDGSTPASGFAAQLVRLADELRGAGLAIGSSELLDAFAALELVRWPDPDQFQQALAATLAKSPEDRRVFDAIFARFCFGAAEAQAIAVEPGKQSSARTPGSAAGKLDLGELRRRIAQALANGDESQLRDLARLAVAALGKVKGSGVLAVDAQRIIRALGLRAGQHGDELRQELDITDFTREELRDFEQQIRDELERAQIARELRLPAKRPLSELARALPTSPVQDLAAVHRVVAQLRRQLATQGHELRGVRRHARVDVRATMRESLQTGGVPIVLRYRPVRPRRPEIFVLCDVSTSVTSASTFFLSVLHALHDSFRKLRSFVFIERVSEVTPIFQTERDFETIAAKITADAGVADVSGYTDYGRVWRDFLGQVEGDLNPRATVIVLGDARTNGRDPGVEAFAAMTTLAGRSFWLNPEPRLYWNYGDSMISTFEPYCEVFECSRADQLEQFVKALTRPRVV
jgi:uncharacterized protein with von Willebrand factor type A (vWA) domain